MAVKKKKPVKHILPSVKAPTMKKSPAKKKISAAQKLKNKMARISKIKVLSAADKKFVKDRAAVTKARRAPKIKSGKVGTVSKNAGKASAKLEVKAIKNGINVSNGAILNKAGKPMLVKYNQPVKVGTTTVHVPFSRAPNKKNPIAEINRWKKVATHLEEQAKSAKTPAQKAAFAKAIANAKTQAKKHGHKIPAFVKSARDKNPTLVVRAKERAAKRKEASLVEGSKKAKAKSKSKK